MTTSYSATEKVVVAKRGLDGLATMARLGDLEKRSTSGLTDNQQADFYAGRAAYNHAADVLGFRQWADDYTADDLGKAEHVLKGFMSLEEGKAIFERMGSRYVDLHDPRSGLAEGAKPADEIRQMFAAHERQADFTFPTSDETRAISDFANGSSLYVSDFRTQVAMYARTISPWLALGQVINSDNGRPMNVPQITGDPTVYTPGEGTAITPSDATLASVTVTPTGFKALMLLSREALEDEEINLTPLIARCQARAIGLAFGSAATTAILAAINNGGTASGLGGGSTATFFGFEDLVAVQYSRSAPYRSKGAWIMSNGSISKARLWKDKNGQYLWPSEDLVSGQPERLLGAGVYEDPYLAAPASATKSVIYGDAFAGVIVKASPIRVELSTDYLFNTDQVAIKTVQRIAAGVQDANALAYLVSANA